MYFNNKHLTINYNEHVIWRLTCSRPQRHSVCYVDIPVHWLRLKPGRNISLSAFQMVTTNHAHQAWFIEGITNASAASKLLPCHALRLQKQSRSNACPGPPCFALKFFSDEMIFSFSDCFFKRRDGNWMFLQCAQWTAGIIAYSW